MIGMVINLSAALGLGFGVGALVAVGMSIYAIFSGQPEHTYKLIAGALTAATMVMVLVLVAAWRTEKINSRGRRVSAKRVKKIFGEED